MDTGLAQLSHTKIEDLRASDSILKNKGISVKKNLELKKHNVKIFDLLIPEDLSEYEKIYKTLADKKEIGEVAITNIVKNLTQDNKSYIVIIEWDDYILDLKNERKTSKN